MLHPISPTKIIMHKERIEQAIKGEIPPPVTVGLDISNLCNNACPWCLYDEYKKECHVNMSLELILKCTKEMGESGVKGVCYSGGGEPTMNEYIDEAILSCVENGMQASLNTNGCRLDYLTDETIDALTYIRISLDAGSEESHKILHKPSEGSFDQIIKSMKRIKENHRTKIGVGFLVHPLNCREIYSTAILLANIGIDYMQIRPLKNVVLSECEKRITLAETELAKKYLNIKIYESFSKMKDTIDKKTTYKDCYANRLVGNIGPDGKFYVCCELRGIDPIGDMNVSHFADIWFSDRHLKTLEALDISKCPPCKYAASNKIIEDVFINHSLDENFI